MKEKKESEIRTILSAIPVVFLVVLGGAHLWFDGDTKKLTGRTDILTRCAFDSKPGKRESGAVGGEPWVFMLQSNV